MTIFKELLNKKEIKLYDKCLTEISEKMNKKVYNLSNRYKDTYKQGLEDAYTIINDLKANNIPLNFYRIQSDMDRLNKIYFNSNMTCSAHCRSYEKAILAVKSIIHSVKVSYENEKND